MIAPAAGGVGAGWAFTVAVPVGLALLNLKVNGPPLGPRTMKSLAWLVGSLIASTVALAGRFGVRSLTLIVYLPAGKILVHVTALVPPFPVLLFTLVISVALNRFELRINSLQVLNTALATTKSELAHQVTQPFADN